MRVAIVGEMGENGLSADTYNAILRVKNAYSNHESLEIHLILLKANKNSLEALPCDAVFVYDQIEGYYLDKTIEAMSHYYVTYKPSLMVVAVKREVDRIIPKVVVRLNENSVHKIASFLQCDALYYDDSLRWKVKKQIYGGNVNAYYCMHHTGIIAFTSQKKSNETLSTKKTTVHYMTHHSCINTDYIKHIETEEITSDGLLESEFVVICGRGVGSKKNVESIEKWAKSIGASVGGTKKVIDHGWLPVHQLIGQTGHRITPKVCLVIGASGATPFINGIIGSEQIIAINNDKDARIFDYADIGIVDDFRVITSDLFNWSDK